MSKRVPKVYRLRAEGIGASISRDVFVSMLNPKNRGPAWKWEKYISFCEKQVHTAVWLGFSDKDWEMWGDLLEQVAVEASRKEAEKLLRNSAILEWWPRFTIVREIEIEDLPLPEFD